MEITKNSDNEKWQLWQWLVILGLIIAIAVSLYFYIEMGPKSDIKKIYDPRALTIDEEIESYKKQLGTSKNYVAYNRLAGAYVKRARMTGDPSWYILAEQNARASLSNSPVDNTGALLVLSATTMAKHEFNDAKKIAKQLMKEEPKLAFNALGIIFDADYAIGDLVACKKDLEEIAKSTEAMFKKDVKKYDPKLVLDPINNNRYALLNYSEGKTKEAEEYFKKAIKESAPLEAEPKAWIYTLYSTFLIKNGRLSEAKQNLQFSLNNVPEYTSALVQKAEISREEKKWQEVIDILEPVNSKIPRSDIILRLAEAEKNLNNQEKYNKLMAQAEDMLKQELDSGSFGHQRDYVHLLLEKNTSESIKDALKKAESEKSIRKDLDTLTVVAQAEIKNDKWSEAKDTLKIASATGVKDSMLYYLQGKIAENSKDLKEAKNYYKKAVDLNPDFNPEYSDYIKKFLTGNS